MLKSMTRSRSRVCVIDAATRSTLPLTSMGIRVGEVTLTNSTGTPIRAPTLRTRSMSKPAGSFLSSRKPKGGVSSFTPARSLPRSLILTMVPCDVWAVAATVAATIATMAETAERNQNAPIVFPLGPLRLVHGFASRCNSHPREAGERFVEVAVRAGHREPHVAGARLAERRTGHGRDVDLVQPSLRDIRILGCN